MRVLTTALRPRPDLSPFGHASAHHGAHTPVPPSHRYAAGRRGILSRMLDSVLDSQRAHYAARAAGGVVADARDGAIGGPLRKGGGTFTKMLRYGASVAPYIPDMEGIGLKFNEVIIKDAFCELPHLYRCLRSHYLRSARRQWYVMPT